MLLQNPDDLLFCEPALLHQSPLLHITRELQFQLAGFSGGRSPRRWYSPDTATIGKKVATFFLLMGGHSNERQRAIKINENQSMSSVWFTADFHFGHFNIIRYCNRPFANTQEMDEAICEHVNACAKPNDTLYFLGDFCLGGPDRVTAYRKRLACRTIHFIEGNHDRTARKLQHL